MTPREKIDAAGEPPSRSTVLVAAVGGAGTFLLIALVLFRVLGGVNDAANKAADEQRQRNEQLRRQIAQLGGVKLPIPEPDQREEGPRPGLAKNQAFEDLTNPDPALRVLAVSAIARRHMSEPEAVAALVKRLRDDGEAVVRLAALRALVKVQPRPPAVTEALQAALKDDDARVRAEAEDALAPGG
jgi:hypothetical protein